MAFSVPLCLPGSFPSLQLRLIILNPLNHGGLLDWFLVHALCLKRALQSPGLLLGRELLWDLTLGVGGGGIGCWVLPGPTLCCSGVLPRGWQSARGLRGASPLPGVPTWVVGQMQAPATSARRPSQLCGLGQGTALSEHSRSVPICSSLQPCPGGSSQLRGRKGSQDSEVRGWPGTPAPELRHRLAREEHRTSESPGCPTVESSVCLCQSLGGRVSPPPLDGGGCPGPGWHH